MQDRPLLIGVSGWHDSGKTVVMEALITAFRAEGLRVAAIKHAAHGVTVDRPGTDSARLWQAGADAVALVGPAELAIRERAAAPDLGSALARLGNGWDIVLVEGFKSELMPRVIIQRAGDAPLSEGSMIVAVEADAGGIPPGDARLDRIVEAVLAWERGGRGTAFV